MRYREDNSVDLDRARVAVAEWRETHPDGTAGQLVADVGPQFHRHYAVVLRGVLFAVDRARNPCPADADDCVERRARFEAEHPEAVIVTPPTLRDLWRATVPTGQAVSREIGIQITSWSLCDLMDKLDDIYLPEGDQGLPARAGLAAQRQLDPGAAAVLERELDAEVRLDSLPVIEKSSRSRPGVPRYPARRSAYAGSGRHACRIRAIASPALEVAHTDKSGAALA